MNTAQYVVAIGSPFDGVTLHGPFVSLDDAVEFGDGSGEPYEAVTLVSPESV